MFGKYSLGHRKWGVPGFIHEFFVSKTRTSEVRASEGFWHKQQVNKPRTKHFLCRELFITNNKIIFIDIVFWTQIRNKNSLTMQI